jgi:hypothetical protein
MSSHVNVSIVNGLFVIIILVLIVTFNNISVISWWEVLMLEETGVPGENLSPARMSVTNFIT